MRRRDLRRPLIPFGLRGAVDEGGTHRDVVAVGGSVQHESFGRSIGRVLHLRAPGDGVDRSAEPALHGDGRPGCVLLDRDFLAPDGRAAQKDRVARRFRRCGGRVLLWRPGWRLLRRGRRGQDQAQRTGKIEHRCEGARVRGHASSAIVSGPNLTHATTTDTSGKGPPSGRSRPGIRLPWLARIARRICRDC